ncbi:MAG: multidrug efflux SMR transporter [Bacteroidota bacterium]
MNWIMLVVAGFFETGFASCLAKAKETTGAEAAWWLAGFFVSLSISMALLYKAVQTLPIGTAYAVWTGIGAIGTVVVGIFVFKEPAEFWRLVFLTTLIGSIIGLKAVSAS